MGHNRTLTLTNTTLLLRHRHLTDLSHLLRRLHPDLFRPAAMDFDDDLFDDDLFDDDLFDADADEEFYDGEMEDEEEADFFADEMVFGDDDEEEEEEEEEEDVSLGPDLYEDGDGDGVASVGYCAAADDEWESDEYVEESSPEMEYEDEDKGEGVYLSDDSDDVLGLRMSNLGYADDDDEEEEEEEQEENDGDGDGVPSLGLEADDELGVDRLDWLECESDCAGGSVGSMGLDSGCEDDDAGEVDLNSDAEMEDSEYLNCVDSPACWEEELGWEEADVGVEVEVEEQVVSSELHLFDDGGSELHIYGEVEYYDDGEYEDGMPPEWDFHMATHSVAADELADDDDDFMAMDLDLDGVFFEPFVDDEVINGSPPAAKSVIARLPVVCLVQSDLDKNISSCAVCTDEFSVREKVRKLPCSHHYHGECIIPWLKLRNTCPVCRFELPSDDPSYEGWKARDRDESGQLLEGIGMDALIDL